MASTIGSIAGGLLGGGAGAKAGPAGVGTYYPNVGQNNQNYEQLINDQMGNIKQLQGVAPSAAFSNYDTASKNPFAQAFQTGAGQAGQAYTQAGNNSIGYGQAVGGQVNPLVQGSQQVMQMGLDPQRALHDQQRQGAMDTANATNAQYGLSGPWAGHEANQAAQNFETNWQENALQRAMQGLSAGAGGINAAGNVGQQAGNLQTGGAADLYQGSGLPYNTAQGISNNQNLNLNDLISNIGGINNIDQGTMQSLLQYLDQASRYGLQQNQASNQAAGAGASGGMNIGGILGGLLGGLF